MATAKLYSPVSATGVTGATNTGVYVGPHFKTFLVVSNVTGFNSGAGNATIKVFHGPSSSICTSLMTSIATECANGVYELTGVGLHYMKLGFGTAPTMAPTGFVELVVYEDL